MLPDGKMVDLAMQSGAKVYSWHKADAPPRPRLGPFTRRLPTLGPEGRLSAALKTLPTGVLKGNS